MSEHKRIGRLRRVALIAMAATTVCAMTLAACADDADEQEQPTVAQEQQQAERQTERPVAASRGSAEQQEQQEQQEQAMQQEQAQQAAQQQSEEAVYEQAQAAQEQAEQQAAVAQESAPPERERRETTTQSSRSSSQTQPQPAPASDQERSRRATQVTQPTATTFRDYPTIGWRETETDNTSTFSLDVDRTSYFLALNWVEAGYRIEPASVRAEEWINAFDYRYDLPDADDSFAVTTDIVEHPIHSDLHLVRIATQAPEFVDNTPLNVTLVLDASGSMREGNRVEIARAAAETIRNGLRDQDRLAIVQFSDAVVEEVPHQRPDDERLERSIRRLRPGSSTNVQAGLNSGVRFADRIRSERPDAYNYVILMSDGVANVDATDPFAILASAEDRDSSNPLRLITIGVGIQNYNDVLLEQLAQYGNGWYRYLSDVAQARSTFSRDNWLALSIPFADQARAQVRWDRDAVAHWRLVGYENRVTSDASFQQDRKEFAEIPIGSATTAFFEVELTDQSLQRNLIDLGEVELRWLTPMSDESNRQQVQMASDISRFGDDAMLDLGSIVALTSDRYSWFGQPGLDNDVMALAADGLNELAGWFWQLPNDILDTGAGQDFAMLLDAMGAVAKEHESQDPGYSR